MREFIPPATQFMSLPSSFPMKRGGQLAGGRVAYQRWGQPTPAGDNLILILTGMSASAHVTSHPGDPTPGWWEAMVGPGRPIDTDRWHVICVNALGGCHGSTGPASSHPDGSGAYGLDFPALSIEDVADASAHLVRALGFHHLACVIGVSMGAMSALSPLARHPGLTSSHISLSGAVHALPFAIAIRSLQRGAICLDAEWNGGRYDEEHYPDKGMAIARKLGVITYRSALEWDGRFGRIGLNADTPFNHELFGLEFEIEAYLDGHARRFVRNYDPNCYLYLSRAIDRFDLGEAYGGDAGQALARLDIDKALVMGVESDILFPLHQQRQIADGLRAGGARVQFLPLDSPQGHDAFLVDITAFGPPITAFLASLETTPAPAINATSTQRQPVAASW